MKELRRNILDYIVNTSLLARDHCNRYVRYRDEISQQVIGILNV